MKPRDEWPMTALERRMAGAFPKPYDWEHIDAECVCGHGRYAHRNNPYMPCWPSACGAADCECAEHRPDVDAT